MRFPSHSRWKCPHLRMFVSFSTVLPPRMLTVRMMYATAGAVRARQATALRWSGAPFEVM